MKSSINSVMERVVRFNGNIENTRLITHDNCCDGAGCAVVFLEAGGKWKNIRFVAAGGGVGRLYDKEQEFFRGADLVVLADVSCDALMANTLEKWGNCVIIDHHKSAKHLEDRDWCWIDMSKCGSMLLYDYFFNSTDPHRTLLRFCELVNDRDMWIRKEEFSDEMQLYMNFFGRDYFIERAHEDFFCVGWEDYETDIIAVLKHKREEYVETALKTVRFRTIDEKKFGYVFISDHQSIVLHRLIEKFNCDAGVGIMMDGAVVSMRASGKVDVSEICEGYGGGGHPNASGHGISEDVIWEILEVIHP